MMCATVDLLFTAGHILTLLGMLCVGLMGGLLANLESIGRIARWKRAIERGEA